jgi:CRP-like cAMP-binding protein
MKLDPARVQALPLFSSLSAEECDKRADWAEEREVSEGRVLTPEGASGYMFVVIEEGTADVTKDGAVIAKLGPGDHFGEIAILDGGRRTATVVSTSPMKLVAMFGTEFRLMEQQLPAVADLLRSAMEERLGGSSA